MLAVSKSNWLAAISFGAFTLACAFPAAAFADEPVTEIVVTGERLKGEVETDVAPIEELNESDIAALGGSSVTDILTAVAPQAGSGRGRGGGQPVILLNGQRVSNFRELRDLPPEAIKRVQIFPEEVALQYGFRPDQRVINFILKPNFASFTAEIEVGTPQAGGNSTYQFENALTRIGPNTRFNVAVTYEHSSALTENERDIVTSASSAPFAIGGNVIGLGTAGEIDPALSALVGRNIGLAGVPSTASNTPSLNDFRQTAGIAGDANIGAFRTLSPITDRFEVNGTWSKVLAPQTNIAFNANYALNASQSLNGLPSASLLVPTSNPFSPFSRDILLNRNFTTPRALERETTVSAARFGMTFNTLVGGWRWGLTGDYAHVDSETVITRNADFTALRLGILNGTLNPFSADLGRDLVSLAPDVSNSVNQTLLLRSTFSGTIFNLPAGEAKLTLRQGYDRQTLDSRSIRSANLTSAFLARDDINAAANLDVPLIERGDGALGWIGTVSLNANYGRSELSDFGSLTEYGLGLTWSPIKNISLQASIIGDEGAPSIAQLGNPVSVSPNIAFFDFTRGETALIDVISGGNRGLIGEKRRDLKLGLNWSPGGPLGVGVQLEYFRNKSNNTTAAFPLLTPEIEAAFASRITRDAGGRLLSVDQRPVNFDQERSQRIRWGLNLSGGIGPQDGGGSFGGGGFGAGRGGGATQSSPGGASNGTGRPSSSEGFGPPRSVTTSTQTTPRPGGPGAGGGPRGGGGGFGLPGANPPGRWQLAAYHTYRIQDEILIRQGLPRLDLLNGSATSSLGGSPRHEVELSGGLFVKGLGVRISGNYRSATRVNGSLVSNSGDLRFSDLATLNTNFFVNLDNRGNLTKKLPFLKGSRIALRIENILNDIIDVRDTNNIVPLSYQPGFLDPRGRYFEISFRKRF